MTQDDVTLINCDQVAQNTITFCIQEEERIKICPDGTFLVNGKKVKKDIELYHAFVEFFYNYGFYRKLDADKENKRIHVVKSWGTELWFENNNKYCGKQLIVQPDKWSSNGKFHYHLEKDETFFIIEGVLRLDIAKENGEYNTKLLYEGDSFRIFPGVKHRFTSALEIPCKFIEVSTTHRDDDSYRCEWDPEKNEWKK